MFGMTQEKLPPSEVRTQFDITRNSSFAPLGTAGGFSGAMFWQVETIEATYCLRRYPKQSPTPQHLAWIHQVMLHAAANGCPQVETILKTMDDETFVSCDGYLWQLSQWMPGTANYHQEPTGKKLESAVDFLARFHLAAAQINLDFRQSDAIQQRLQLLNQFAASLALVLDRKTGINEIEFLHLAEWLSQNGERLAASLTASLAEFESSILPIQPVIKDIWQDHIFFTGEAVSSVVDFGSLAMDTVSLDLSRMLGSMVGEDDNSWATAIENYAQIRALTKPERQIIPLLDKTGVLLGSLNWLTWIVVEERTFEDLASVKKRASHLLGRLTTIIS